MDGYRLRRMSRNAQVNQLRTSFNRTTHGQELLEHAVSHRFVVRRGGVVWTSQGLSIGIGIRGLVQDLGMKFRVRTNTDSAVASGISKRRGLGKVRHIELNQLWIQDKVISGEIEVIQLKGEDDRSDSLTKHVAQNHIGQHMDCTGQGVEAGRHELAPYIEI